MKFYVPFFTVSLVHLSAELFGWQDLGMWTKPILIPSLAIGLYANIFHQKISAFYFKTVFVALAFSTVGDVFLQFEKILSNDLYFYIGLGAFLIAQCMYILSFFALGSRPISTGWSVIYMIYFIFFLMLLYPGMDLKLKIPVTIYGAGLILMAWYAWRSTISFAFRGLFAVLGSILFVISDSLLAINRFKLILPYAGFMIMLTYILAQYLMVLGIFKKVQVKAFY